VHGQASPAFALALTILLLHLFATAQVQQDASPKVQQRIATKLATMQPGDEPRLLSPGWFLLRAPHCRAVAGRAGLWASQR
jgi:hypothetical protein